MRRDRAEQRCLNTFAFAGMAAGALSLARLPRLAHAAVFVAVVALFLTLVLSVRSTRR